MKNILITLFTIVSNVSISQIPISSASGIYELRDSTFRKIISVDYETMVTVDTITHQLDQTEIRYDIKFNQKLVCTIQSKIEDKGLRILLVYADYSTESQFIPKNEFETTEYSFKHKTKRTEIAILKNDNSKSIGPPVIINLPIQYKGEEKILHLQPHTK